VILERELLPLVDVKDLADVVASLGPDELVAPGFSTRAIFCLLIG